jgi:hypothetical protein
LTILEQAIWAEKGGIYSRVQTCKPVKTVNQNNGVIPAKAGIHLSNRAIGTTSLMKN